MTEMLRSLKTDLHLLNLTGNLRTKQTISGDEKTFLILSVEDCVTKQKCLLFGQLSLRQTLDTLIWVFDSIVSI